MKKLFPICFFVSDNNKKKDLITEIYIGPYSRYSRKELEEELDKTKCELRKMKKQGTEKRLSDDFSKQVVFFNTQAECPVCGGKTRSLKFATVGLNDINGRAVVVGESRWTPDLMFGPVLHCECTQCSNVYYMWPKNSSCDEEPAGAEITE